MGAVLQHKAPRDIAQFLQRRGRAGRLQEQRPWTVAVFSDYGRDRLAFQSYETILDPSVPAKSLPFGNQSVRKMQAAMCLVDWIAVRLGADGSQRFSARWLLARPRRGDARHVQACLDLLGEVLDGGPAQQDLIALSAPASGSARRKPRASAGSTRARSCWRLSQRLTGGCAAAGRQCSHGK